MKKVRVLISCKGKDLKEKVMAVTRKCYELKDEFPNFSWEFHNYNGELTFSAAHWSGVTGEKFEFPIHMVEVDEKYDYIMHALEELKWTALLYEKEDEE